MVCGGDGFENVSFTVTFLGLGDRVLFSARNRSESSTNEANGGLFQSQQIVGASAMSNVTAHRTRDVSVTIEELQRGGVQITPLPGRYLTAPSDIPVVSVRVTNTSTARCKVLAWAEQDVGCYHIGANHLNNQSLVQKRPTSSLLAWTPESCANACRGRGTHVALGPSPPPAPETCYCLQGLPNVAADVKDATSTDVPTLAEQDGETDSATSLQANMSAEMESEAAAENWKTDWRNSNFQLSQMNCRCDLPLISF